MHAALSTLLRRSNSKYKNIVSRFFIKAYLKACSSKLSTIDKNVKIIISVNIKAFCSIIYNSEHDFI